MRPKPLILVAEDNQALRKMLSLVLTRSGYDVTEAVDGQEAVEQAGRERPDLILLDIRMPRLNGIEALRQIRQMPGRGDVPAIMLSALSQRSEVVAAVRAGACDYIIKSGFNIQAFLSRIGSMFHQAHAEPSAGAGGPRFVVAENADGPDEAGPSKRDSSPSEPPLQAEAPEKPCRACRLRDAGNLAELADHTPPISQASLRDQAQRIGEVKALPFVLPQVLALTASSFSSAEQLEAALEKDVALAGKVLAMANSSFYRRGREAVTSLKQAIRNIGFGSVRQVALGVGLMDLFGQSPEHPGIDRVRHWEHSMGTGSIARLLALRAGMDESQAFVVGLLHNMGGVIYDEFFGNDYAAMLALWDSDRLTPWDLERRWMGLDHAHLAAAVMRHWQMPSDLYEPIDDSRLPLAALLNKHEPRRRWAGLVKLANQLATCIGLGDPRVNQLSHVDNELVDDFGVDDALLEELRDTVPVHLRELKIMMLAYMPRMNLEQTSRPVSDRPILYLCTRPPHADVLELYLRLRHRKFEAFTTVEAFAARLESAEITALAVVNLLPGPILDRTLTALDDWAGRCPKAASIDGLVLARHDQADQLVGAFGQAFNGLLAPAPVCKLDRLIGLRDDSSASQQ